MALKMFRSKVLWGGAGSAAEAGRMEPRMAMSARVMVMIEFMIMEWNQPVLRTGTIPKGFGHRPNATPRGGVRVFGCGSRDLLFFRPGCRAG